MTGIDEADIALLRAIGRGEPSEDLMTRVAALWAKADALSRRLGAAIFGDDGYTLALWPHGDRNDLAPFLWARLKRAGNEGYATHIGVFIAPGFCNLSLDLEKDPLDAGESRESLGDVIAFFRDHCAAIVAAPERDDLRVWMDRKNVVAAAAFGRTDFDAFVADNRDTAHPWPKAGYLLDADEVSGFDDRWLDEYAARAAALVPLYDAAIAGFPTP